MLAVQANQPITIITNVNVFDGVNEKLIGNASVVVSGNLITEVSTEPLSIAGAEMIDGNGGTLIPGLIDMHWHSAFNSISVAEGLNTDLAYHLLIGAKSNEKALLRGFTTVRDMAGNVFSLKRLTDAGIYDGPRIFPSGPAISQTSGHSDFRPATAVPKDLAAPLHYTESIGHFVVADGVPEVLLRTREALRMGASQIKIMSGGGVSSLYDPIDVTQYTDEETKAAVATATDWNTYVSTHVFTDGAAQRAINAGVHEY